ncbi:MAG: glycerol-3-phosphate 1-O-acyltransferase PlsY [Rhodospirillales bacterium]|nr:glycerol-3-phosphate 1-O-acyltransferase PlsY [Rhodospirillales bacterium]
MTGTDTAHILMAVLIGYFAGSIPFGLLLTRIAGLGDIRQLGSGNIGATNVLRTGNKKLAALTLLLDCGKGLVPTLAIGSVAPALAPLAGVAAVIGHNFPIWLGFRGGKGVATTLGVLAGLSWPVGILTAGVWIGSATVFRYSSLAALIALACAPIMMVGFAEREDVLAAALLTCLAFIRHHGNIRRLVSGTEPKIGQGTSHGDQAG